jgi:hypothetical protein
MNDSARYCPALNGIILLGCLALFSINQLVLKPHYPEQALLNNWFNDLLAIPSILVFSSIVRYLTQARITFSYSYYIVMQAACSTLLEIGRQFVVKSAVAD